MEFICEIRILRQVRLMALGFEASQLINAGGMVLDQEFQRVLAQIEQLGSSDLSVENVPLDEFPVPFLDATHTGFRTTVVNPVHDISQALFFAHEDRLEAQALVGLGGLDAGKIAQSSKGVEQVNVSFGSTCGRNFRATDDHRNSPCVLVEVLFALESMPSDSDPVVGSVEDVGVLKFSHRLKLIENPPYLSIDIFAASELATKFVADGSLVAMFPNARYIDFVTQFWMTVWEGVRRKVVFRQWRLSRVGRGAMVPIGMVDGSVLGQQFERSISLIVGMRETEIDQEGGNLLVGLERRFAGLEKFENLIGVPCAAGFGCPASFGRIPSHGELLVGFFVAVTLLASPHGDVSCPVENGWNRLQF